MSGLEDVLRGLGAHDSHYGTHYSSSMIVCGFLIRLSPFTEIFLALQVSHHKASDKLTAGRQLRPC